MIYRIDKFSGIIESEVSSSAIHLLHYTQVLYLSTCLSCLNATYFILWWLVGFRQSAKATTGM